MLGIFFSGHWRSEAATPAVPWLQLHSAGRRRAGCAMHACWQTGAGQGKAGQYSPGRLARSPRWQSPAHEQQQKRPHNQEGECCVKHHARRLLNPVPVPGHAMHCSPALLRTRLWRHHSPLHRMLFMHIARCYAHWMMYTAWCSTCTESAVKVGSPGMPCP